MRQTHKHSEESIPFPGFVEGNKVSIRPVKGATGVPAGANSNSGIRGMRKVQRQMLLDRLSSYVTVDITRAPIPCGPRTDLGMPGNMIVSLEGRRGRRGSRSLIYFYTRTDDLGDWTKEITRGGELVATSDPKALAKLSLDPIVVEGSQGDGRLFSSDRTNESDGYEGFCGAGDPPFSSSCLKQVQGGGGNSPGV